MEIVVAVQNPDIRDVLSFSLESQLRLSVHAAKTAGDALEILIRHPNLEIIVLEHPAFSEPVLQYLKATQRLLKVFLLVSPQLAPAQWNQDLARLRPTDFTQDPDWVKGILPKIAAVIDPHADLAGTGESEDAFARIRPNLLLMASPLKGDVFLKLGDQKFVKLFSAGAEFNKTDYQKYVTSKNVEFLYLKKEDAGNFMERLQAKISASLDSGAMDDKKANETAINLHQTVRELITKIEPAESLSPLIKEQTRLTLRAVGRNPKLKGLIQKLTLDPQSYISSHSVALSQLCCGIAASMEWGSETTFHKLNLAAFLHDITLENQELARIHSLEELNAKKDRFTAKEVAEYPLHPMRAAELARKFPEVPPDVDQLIVQQHELPDGTGFPRRLSAKQISPLSSLFIVAHELIHYISDKGVDFQMNAFLDLNAARYSAGHFKKVLSCLLKTRI